MVWHHSFCSGGTCEYYLLHQKDCELRHKAVWQSPPQSDVKRIWLFYIENALYKCKIHSFTIKGDFNARGAQWYHAGIFLFSVSIKCGWKSKCPTSEGFFPTSNSWRQEEEHTFLRKIRLNLAQWLQSGIIFCWSRLWMSQIAVLALEYSTGLLKLIHKASTTFQKWVSASKGTTDT